MNGTTIGDKVSLQNISLSFGGVRAVSDISITLDAGAISAIIGPNGAGKSSVLNILSGIYRPDGGALQIGERSYPRLTPGLAASIGIGRTFQNIALFKAMTVLDNIVMGRVTRIRTNALEQALGLPRARREEDESRTRAEEVIAFLDLQSYRHTVVGTLPYGLQKRVELGRALIAEPRVLLLDEPMAGMNASEKRDMCSFVLQANEELQATIVLIEHDVGLVMALADHIVVMDHGEKIGDGPPDEIRNNQRVMDAYLGVAEQADTAMTVH